ncbi:hypothetical protein [Bacillus sp. FJAT-50079]|uniref:hypothetical protein n=1 Tax=Bacillus sp. FJAT-50079 TaxID=2833577 RepID=UPI001BC8E514|nr:hypothetical protein [Bacillus sp. FJAT-50079]MBS4208061.1 hypothetical protein [Bacillus sp. FJAT-50079]
MLNQDIWDGYEGRMRLLNPFFSFGKGIQITPYLNPFIENILLAVLLELFYREVRNNDARTEGDILEIVQEVLGEMKLESSEKDSERLVTGLLYSNPQTLEAFQGHYYSVKNQTFEVHQFKYLIPDLELMSDNAPSIIYKLSDDAQFILFSSREITSELSISLEQLYMIQLLRKGNIEGVLKQTDFLLQRVRHLIAKETAYGREIIREPKIILREGFDDRSKREEEIRIQFREEDENFRHMHTLLFRIEERNEGLYDVEAKKKMNEIRDRLNQTTIKHAEFNTMVTRNIALILDIRTNRPDLLMRKSSKRYKEDVWEKLIWVEGVPDGKVFQEILSPLFSPQSPALFSLDRVWAKQRILTERVVTTQPVEQEIYEMKAFEYVLYWGNILEKWIPILDELLKHQTFTLQSLESLEGWSKDAIELWMQFTKEQFTVPIKVFTNQPYKDEREEFIRQAILQNPKYAMLEGSIFYVENHYSETIRYNDSVLLTDGTLRLKLARKGE